VSSLYILIISPLSDVQLTKIFSHSVIGLFSLETISFVVQKLFNFMMVPACLGSGEGLLSASLVGEKMDVIINFN
jgi:hypothetical protein